MPLAAMSELQAEMLGQPWPATLRQWVLAKAWVMAEHPGWYWAAGSVAFGLLVACGLLIAAQGDRGGDDVRARPGGDGGGPARTPPNAAPPWRTWSVSEWFLLLATAATVLLWRWPSLGLGHQNIDEDVLMFGMGRLNLDPVYWRSMTGSTSGPLNFYVPLLIHRVLGLPPDYASVRLVATGLILVELGLFYFAARCLCGPRSAAVAIVPLALFHATATTSDYVHHSSELVSIALLSGALLIMARLWHASRVEACYGRFLLAGMVLGLLPYAKLQSAPMGVYLALCAAAMAVWRGRPGARRGLLRLVCLGSGGIAATGIVLLYVWSFGLKEEFWGCYVVSNLSFSRRIFPARGYSVLDDILWLDENRLLIKALVGGFLVSAPVCALRFWHLAREQWALAVGTCGFVGVALFCALKPGTNWPHYFQYLHLPLCLLLAVVLGNAMALGSTWSLRGVPARRCVAAIPALTLLFLAAAAVRHRAREPRSPLDMAREAPGVLGDRASREVVRRAMPGDTLAVWGYMTQLYTFTGLTSAVRDSPTHYAMLREFPLHDYFRRLYSTDLQRHRPTFLCDSVCPLAVQFRDRARYGIETYPGLADIVRAEYEPFTESEGIRVLKRNLPAANRLTHSARQTEKAELTGPPP
jgi:hypothetical protein